FFFSSRRRHTRFSRDWSSDVCSSDLETSLQVSGGTLEVIGAVDGATPKFNISADGFASVEFSPGALVYRSDRGTEVITLENGAEIGRASCRERVKISVGGV